PAILSLLFFYYTCAQHRSLHSFPTRRSSDLLVGNGGGDCGVGVPQNDRAPRAKVIEELVAVGVVEVLATGVVNHQGLSANGAERDRKSTRLNSSHLGISYAVFCLKKKQIQ